MKRILSLVLILAVFWIINSGYFEPLLLGFGIFSVAGVTLLVLRMDKIDHVMQLPVFLSWRIIPYLLWLLKETALANIDVVKHIWEPTPKISPVIFDTFTLEEKTEFTKVLYANSISITPGTVILDIVENVLEIHALTLDTARGLLSGKMGKRVSILED